MDLTTSSMHRLGNVSSLRSGGSLAVGRRARCAILAARRRSFPPRTGTLERVEPLAVGSPAPPIPGVDFSAGPTTVFFYKVTCPVCQMASPKVQRFEEAYSGRIVGV